MGAADQRENLVFKFYPAVPTLRVLSKVQGVTLRTAPHPDWGSAL